MKCWWRESDDEGGRLQMFLRIYLNGICVLADSTNSHIGAENLTKQVLDSPVVISHVT